MTGETLLRPQLAEAAIALYVTSMFTPSKGKD